jgi:plasmid stabilization system protein ParE
MKRDAFLLRQAEIDIDTILAWLVKLSPAGARSWFRALETAIEWLELHASSSPLAPENDWFAEEIRQHIFKTKRGRPYRLLFTVVGKQVRILHVRGPGQDLVRPTNGA